MTDEDVRNLFNRVLVAPDQDTTDVETAVRTGRLQRRRAARRRALATAVLAAAVVLGVITYRLIGSAPPLVSASAGAPTNVARSTASVTLGRVVTSPDELYGVWQTVRLDGQDVHALRDSSGRPLTVSFGASTGKPMWFASDGCNTYGGDLAITVSGAFAADQGVAGLVRCVRTPVSPRNVSAVRDADQAQTLAATGDSPRRLILTKGGVITAEYTAVAA